VEGGGIGDGEGIKDVSEQIESEEQVCCVQHTVCCAALLLEMCHSLIIFLIIVIRFCIRISALVL